MQRKGFMFTIDSLACVTIAIILIFLVPAVPRIKTSERSQYIFMEKIARDKGVVALYTNDLANDPTPNIVGATFVCKKYFKLEPNTTTTQTNVSRYNKCITTTVVS